jgi:hypothetical protein
MAGVGILSNHEAFSVSNFRYYATRDGLAVRFPHTWDAEPLGVEYLVVKTGDVGPWWTEVKIRRARTRLAADPHLARVFPVIGEFELPDGSQAVVRARRLTADLAASPSAIAAALERGVARQLSAVARDVEDLRVALAWDSTIREGRIARADVRAAAATLGEFTRPGAAALRVGDLHLVFEEVLVNPHSALAEERIDVLDVGRIRLPRATISAGDLQAFLRSLPRFRLGVQLGPGVLDVRARQFGLDLTGRILIVPGKERPFGVVATDVRLGGLPVPGRLVDVFVRTLDPSGSIARRLPAPVAVGAVTITPEAIRIGPE